MPLKLYLPGREKHWSIPPEITAAEFAFTWQVAKDEGKSFTLETRLISLEGPAETVELRVFPALVGWYALVED